MVWKCPPLNLFNWSNFWKWKEKELKNEKIDNKQYDAVDNNEPLSDDNCGK
jgi:hypothetical protein